MIVFFSKDAEEVMLAAIIKHYNPSAIMRLYENNEDLLSIAKIYNESNFFRIKDYKLAIINQYDFPEWIKDDSKLRFIELVIANNKTNIYSLINHLAEYLFSPEKLFYSSLDKTVMFKDNAMQVINELGIFKRFNKSFTKNGIIYFEINPEHDIIRLYSKSISKKCNEPFAVLNGDNALISNAKKAGFKDDIITLNRFDALRIKREIKVSMPLKNQLKGTVATKIIEY
ncbi:MAG: hypothetical protein PHN56_02060 [Candidatus Nanoarchaeia archaeon]|nr:hypothetical protein [Candidatus Nanoarchaeia archaeon]